MDINTFIKELEKLGITPSKEQLEAFEIYKDMLLDYNVKFNLTAIKTTEEIYLKHFYDSLTIIKVVDLKDNLKILDIGTGAGFPGLVLKIMFPNLEITLIDSNNKKITFLKEVIKKLNLDKITCIHGRVEELDDSYRGSFDIVTSRAVAHLRILSELSIPYLKVGGYFIPMKGNLEEELKESVETIKALQAKLIEKTEFTLPIENSHRTILKIKKEKETSKKYPRKYDMIVKRKIK